MDDVQQVKDRIDITELIGSYLQIKRSGSNYKAICPFHSEKTPSFMVNPERQIFKCFGCGEAGDVFEFLMKMENLTFPEALELLAQKVGYQLSRNPVSPKKYEEQKNAKAILYKINQTASAIYHKLLLEHDSAKPAREYLEKRQINPETINKFQIGYAPNQPINPILLKRGFTSQDIQTAGNFDRFRDRIVFPLFDTLGNIVGFTARALAKDAIPKYLNTPETPIFIKGNLLYGLHQGKQKIKDKDYAILLEGQMDVIASHQCKVENAVASSGTALTREHLKILSRYTGNLIFSFDMDEAGQKTTLSAIELAQEAGFTVKIAVLPTGYKDAGEAIEESCQIFTQALKDATYSIDWVYISAQKKYNSAGGQLSIAQKKKIAKEVLPFIIKISDPIERSHWVTELGKKLSVSQDSVLQAIANIEKKSQSRNYNSSKNNPPTTDKIRTKTISPEELLFGLLELNSEQKAKYPELYKRMAKEYAENSQKLQIEAEEYSKSASVDDVSKEIAGIVKKLELEDKEQIKTDFASKIAQAEKNKNLDEVKKLLKDLQEKIG